MKIKQILLVIFITTASIINAQDINPNLITAFNNLQNNELKQAKISINLVMQDDSLRWSPKAWFIKAMIYQKIYESKDSDFFSIKETAIDESYKAYQQTLEFDKKKKYNSDIRNQLLVLSNQYSHKGVNEYNQYKYTKALESFEKALEIQNMPMILNVDTLGIYNAAMAALNAKNNTKSKLYFQKLIDFKFGGSKIYMQLSKIYKGEANFVNSEDLLKKALDLFPEDNEAINNELINMYLSDNRISDAKVLLNNAILTNPNNSQYHYVISTLYDTKKDFEIMKNHLLRAIELNPNYIEAITTIAILYFNQAIIVNKELNVIQDDMIYKTEKKKVEVLFKKSIPYFEKVYKANPKDTQTQNNLRFLYERYNLTEKLDSL